MLKEISTLFKKEWQLEWRNNNTVAGILLYVLITIFVAFRAFGPIEEPPRWNALFWVILVFSSIHAVQKTFLAESKGQHLYYYSLAHPSAIILSKILYNSVLMILIGGMTLLFYTWLMGGDALASIEMDIYFVNLFLGCIGFSSVFTFISAISAQTSNNIGIMAILSFPLVLPMVILLMNIANLSLQGGDWSTALNPIIVMLSLNVLVVTLAALLFPFVWKD